MDATKETLKAGEKLDVLVAEKVMGMTREDWSQFCPTCKYDGMWGSHTNPYVPPFSTDIATAWEVVQKLKSDGCFIQIHNGEKQGVWSVYMAGSDGFQKFYAESESAPHAICLVALKMVEGRPGRT